jgi:small-conductance mechanosensitive channel
MGNGKRAGLAAASAGVVALEALGTLMMWAPIPLAWLWVGGRVYDLTGSLGADLAVAFLGFVGTILATVLALTRIDRVWVDLRRRAGHEQDDGALTQVAIVSGTIGIVAFLLWYYLLARAFVMPFMPSN